MLRYSSSRERSFCGFYGWAGGPDLAGALTFPLRGGIRRCLPLLASGPYSAGSSHSGPGDTHLPGKREDTVQRGTSPLINTMKRESASFCASRKEKRPLNLMPEKQFHPFGAFRGARGERRGHTFLSLPHPPAPHFQRLVRKLSSKTMRVISLQNVV